MYFSKETDEQIKNELVEWGRAIVVAIFFFLFLRCFFSVHIVEGTSMLPTIAPETRVVTMRTWIKKPKIGDIVVTSKRNKTGKTLIKRIVADENDVVSFKNGKMFVDGKESPVNEGIIEDTTDNGAFQAVPQASYFLAGDNRPDSLDSRNIGFFAADDVQETVLFQLKF